MHIQVRSKSFSVFKFIKDTINHLNRDPFSCLLMQSLSYIRTAERRTTTLNKPTKGLKKGINAAKPAQ